MATDRMLGRLTASTGAVEELTSAQVTANFVDAATDAAAGKVELATNGEAQAGTSTNLVLVPASMKSAQIQLGTAVTLTNQTAVDFTGIPSWAKRVTVMLSEVSTNGSNAVQIQVGAGSVVTSGYVGAVDAQATGGGSTQASTSGLLLERSAVIAATSTRTGVARFERVSGNRWNATYLGAINVSNNLIAWSAVTISLGGDLDRVRLTSNGTDQFDAGTVNISWE
jgi:hypothetical protein